MDELIEEMKKKGLISFRGAGKAKAAFQLLEILATTEPVETDKDWWVLRLWLRRN